MAEKKSIRCVIISGGPDFDYDFVSSFVREDDYVICADKGCEYAKRINITPDLIIGDFDSFKDELPETELITLNTHKDDTDTEHCAKEAVKRGFKQVIILCATGGRSDHSFANLCILQWLNENDVDGIIINKEEKIEFKSTGKHQYLNQTDKTFSVFPFGCSEAVVSYYGDCEYKAENLTLKSSSAIGISNIFKCDNVIIEVKEGSVLIFTENIKY